MTALNLSLKNKGLLIFGACHALFLIVSIVPIKWRDGAVLTAVFHIYQGCTACNHNWNMFETIPSIHHLDARLVVKDGSQKLREEGVLLPGLRRYPLPENPRLYSWVESVAFSTSLAVFRESYMKKAAAELLRSGRYDSKAEVSLEVNAAYTRSLLGVQKLREIAVERASLMGPFPISNLASKTPAAN